MIPKTIHYCWFGKSPLPPLPKECVSSWKKQCPDYKVICWNEENYDIHKNPFVEQAYQAGQWAFVADYVRLEVLLNHGGVYLDTDVELRKPLDPLLEHDCFLGFESRDTVATGVIGCTPGHPLIRKLFANYEDRDFLKDGERGITTGPELLTTVLREDGLRPTGKKQQIDGCVVFPCKTFYPTGMDWVLGRYSDKTVSVHHYTDSWRSSRVTGKRSVKSRIRLSAVFLGRNMIGTEKMNAMGKILKRKEGR
ncbi:MAG: glycosyl transferase [Oscillospiraceae bacterium]|nr:glycosyl transferase [Oscillospiraceae bacterium]